jgi:L-ribulose-5-phosphate 4-epimerase
MAASQFSGLKERVWRANMEIPARGLAIYTWGNVSGLDAAAGVFAIKPSGVPYDELKAEDIVVVDLEGKVVEGKLKPSSDTPTHAVLYRHFAGLGAIVHTHSTHACAWAQAGRAIPIYGTTHADHLACDVPCTDFMTDRAVRNDYEVETGKQILAAFKAAKLDPALVPMVLVAGHGPFAWGATPEKAVYNAAVLEEVARMAWMSEQINPRITRLKASIVNKHFERKHGPKAYYGQSGAKE